MLEKLITGLELQNLLSIYVSTPVRRSRPVFRLQMLNIYHSSVVMVQQSVSKQIFNSFSRWDPVEISLI